jgi:hypothetical protein
LQLSRPILAALAITVISPAAHADEVEPMSQRERNDFTKHDWPVQPILRPLTLAPKMREVSGDTFLFNLSSGQIAAPIAIAPTIRSGLTRRLTLNIIHELGICISTNGCGSTYNDVGLEAEYSLWRGSLFQATFRAGLQAPRFDRFFFGARAGVTMRVRLWPIAVVLSPTLYAGFVGRDDQPPPEEGEPDPDPVDATGRAELIDVPITVQAQLGPRGLLILISGLAGPLSGLGDAYRVPIGFGGLFAINHKVDLGLVWRFDDLLGQAGSIDFRTLLIRAALRF